MTELYKIVGDLRSQFIKMTFGLTKDKNEVDEVVQELMIYFLQMNPDTLKGIYDKDGKQGLIRYGAVVIRRSLQSPRSPYYYKYKKYYTHIDGTATTYDEPSSKDVNNIPNPEPIKQWQKLEQIDEALEDIYWYDKQLFKLYYYENNTLDSLASKTGISRNSLFTTIDNVRNELKDKLNE